MQKELRDKLKEKNWIYKEHTYSPYFEYVEYQCNIQCPSISVIVISWRLHPDTIKNFRILEHQRDNNFELIFVDNGADPGEFDELRPFIDTYVRLNTNTGAYLARNIGALFAKAPILLFLEDDGIPDPDLIESHLNTFCRYEVIGIRGIYIPKNDNYLNKKQTHYFHGIKPFPSYCNLEGNASYDSKVFFKVGGWDDEINFGGGGIDLSLRLLQVEPDYRKQIYSPISIIFHDYAVSDDHLKNKQMKQKASLERLKKKHSNWDEATQTWKKLYKREDLLIDKDKAFDKYKQLAERVLIRNNGQMTEIGKPIFCYDSKRVKELVKRIKTYDKVTIFGASGSGKAVVKLMHENGIKVANITDNDNSKWGNYFEGIKVIPPHEIGTKSYILVASVWFEEISLQLEKMGFINMENFVVILA